MNKEDYLNYFESKINEFISLEKFNISSDKKVYKKQTQKIGKFINDVRKKAEKEVFDDETLEKSRIIDKLLMIQYVSYVVSLEYRNKFWPYDNMSFSRRVGEFWEPLCDIPFENSLKKLTMFKPKRFLDVEKKQKETMKSLLNGLSISKAEKNDIFSRYLDVWKYINSESIQLPLDLHFKQGEKYYDVDYKSGFSSNEKGNTNRLLMVAEINLSLQKLFGEEHENILLVRQKEYENNHYLETLKNSGKWNVFCGEDAYEKIYEFTGYNLKNWINSNIDWENDLSGKFYSYLESKDLIRYLQW